MHSLCLIDDFLGKVLIRLLSRALMIVVCVSSFRMNLLTQLGYIDLPTYMWCEVLCIIHLLSLVVPICMQKGFSPNLTVFQIDFDWLGGSGG